METTEGKIIGYIAALAVIIGIGAWANNYTAIADIRSKLTDETRALQGVQISIEALQHLIPNQRKNLAEAKAAQEADTALINKPAELALQLTQLKKNAAEKTSATLALAQDFETALMKVRNAAVGTTIPQMMLTSGKVIPNALIKRVSEDTVVVGLATGSARLHRADLTKDWIERFQLVEPKTIVTVNAGAGTPTTAATTPSPPGTTPPAPSTAVGRPTAANPTKIVEIRNKIAYLRAQAQISTSNSVVWNQTASQLESKFKLAEASGRIVTNKYKVTEAQKTASSCIQKAAALEAEAVMLENQLYILNSGG